MSQPCGLSERMHYLKQFQLERLQHTYADFMAQPPYRTTCDFFFGQVYTVEDTGARDQAVEAFYNHLSRILGGDLMRCLSGIIDLQKLTVTLDDVLASQLTAMQAPIVFDVATHDRAYAACGNADIRRQQIQLLVDALSLAHRVLRRFGVGTGLKALHRFHRLRGEGQVTGFLLDAYRAIAGLRDIHPLTQAIWERETKRLERLFSMH